MTPALLLPNRDPGELVLTFAGSVVKHLGVQMYSGKPVPAIAELISNSWDADASEVHVSVPLDMAWDPSNADHEIRIEDDGIGMNWEMVRDGYLDVGRDRRQAEGTDKSPGGRLLQGRKGIGKLAGFGIADVVEVQTIHRDEDASQNERVLLWFRLSLDKLKQAGRDPAPVELLYAGPVSKAPEGARTTQGTTVVLRSLHQRRAINGGRFRRSMSRRFLLLGPQFRVAICGQDLDPEDYELQWRWPDEGWLEAEVPGCGPVSYWMGFSESPLHQNDGDLSGILIYTRGKVSQEATFFDISGGVTGQHGLRYMCGMVKAEWLDLDADLIATHRGAIAWESPQGQAMQTWGQTLVKQHLAEWAKRRAERREKQVRELNPRMRQRVEALAPSYRTVALTFIEKFKSVEMEAAEFEEILSWFLDALENATLRSIIQKIREADASDLEQLNEFLTKLEVRTAVTLLQIVESNLAAIDGLEKLHSDDARERGVLSTHLERNPWLMHPAWMLSRAEARVSTWIRDEFGLAPAGDEGDLDRADFFCAGVAGTLHIVEIKRASWTATSENLLQANKYREYVLRRFTEITDPEAVVYYHVQSHLIANQLRDDAKSVAESFRNSGFVFFTTWTDLIERAKRSHAQFRDALSEAAGVEGASQGDAEAVAATATPD